MKEINEKDLEKAAGGFEFDDFEYRTAGELERNGATRIVDKMKGFSCDGFSNGNFPGSHGPCGVCKNLTHASDTFEKFCTLGK